LRFPETPKRLVQEVPDTVIRYLAQKFGVSLEVILRRLVTIGRLPMAVYLRKREEFRRLYSSRTVKSGFAPPDIMAIATNGKRFTRMVLDAYSDDKISTSDVFEYLGVRPKHLDSIKSKLDASDTEEPTEA
jgi:Zn-dependent peptidase ImmA (M78 family)